MATTTTGSAQHPLTRLAVDNIGKRLDEMGMTWHQLAEKSRRAPSGVSFIHSHRRGVTLPVLAEFAAILRTAPWMLLRPPEPCPHCGGWPEAGFMCLHCGATDTPPRAQEAPRADIA